MFIELILLTEKDPRNFSISKIFITANNQELECRFHSSTAATNIDTFIKLLSNLSCVFSLEFQPKLKVKFRIMMFPYVCTVLWHYMCSENCGTITELLLLEFDKRGAKIRNF